MALTAGLPPLAQQFLQPFWKYFGIRDRGTPENNPVPTGFLQGSFGDLLAWNYTQPTGENALIADGFILYLNAGVTTDPDSTQLRLAVESRSFLAPWVPAGQRSYAIAAYRNTHQGEAVGPKQQLDAWVGATGGATTDLAQYLFLPGRPGGQIAHGGTADGDMLELIPNTATTRKDPNMAIGFDDAVNPITLDASTSGGGFFKVTRVGTEYHIVCGTGAIVQQCLAYEPTIFLDDTTAGTYALFLYGSGASLKVEVAAAIFVLMLCYNGTVIDVKSGASVTIALVPGFFGNIHYILEFGALASTVGEHVDLWSQPQITNNSANSFTMPRFVMHMMDIQKSGSGAIVIPANIGLECEDQTIGTVVAAVRSHITSGAGKFCLLDDGGAPSVVAGTMDTAGFKVLGTDGIDATIVTAPLTALGATGSQTFTKGILTAQTPAT